jgi:exonuclease III
MQTANNRNKMTTSKTRKLSMTFPLNIRGMQPGIKNQKWKRHDIEQRVEELGAKQDLPFFVLTETHLKSYVKDAEIAIEGYSMIRADRPVRPQGGVAICYKQHLSAVESRSFSNKTCEVCISQIVQLNVTIVAVYRPPDTTKVLFKEALTEIERYLTDISKQKSDLLIMGDLNFPNVNWDTKTAKSGCSKNDKDCFSDLCKVMEDHFLIQVIDKPTRKDNLLDIVLTNSSDLVKRVTTEDTVMSDHR